MGCWPLASPAFDQTKSHNVASTNHNTSESNKLMTCHTNDGYSDVKTLMGFNESPCVIRKFMDHDSMTINLLQQPYIKSSDHSLQNNPYTQLMQQQWNLSKNPVRGHEGPSHAEDDDQYYQTVQIPKLDFSKQIYQTKRPNEPTLSQEEQYAEMIQEDEGQMRSDESQAKAGSFAKSRKTEERAHSAQKIPMKFYQSNRYNWAQDEQTSEGGMMDNEDYDQSNDNEEDMIVSTKKMSQGFQPNKNLIGRSYVYTD